MNIFKKYVAAVTTLVISLSVGGSRAEASVDTSIILPNIYGKSLTTPVAWGAAYGTVFAGVGIESRAPYSRGSAFSTRGGDGGASIGLGVGNPVENLGLQAALTMYDVSNWGRYGMSFHVHHYLGSASSIGVGGQNLMLSSGTDSEQSYYIVYSKGVLSSPFINTDNNTTRLHYSIGAGNGQFGNKTGDDILAGKGKHGTYIFGNIAYELFNQFNFITDWNGINLNAGISKTFLISDSFPVIITAGAVDLTGYSGDGVRFIVGIGTGITL